VKTTQFGNQTGIGASFRISEINGKLFAHDCGIGFARSGEVDTTYLPEGNFLQGRRIDVIIITHTHYDHIGAILRLVRHHPEAYIVISDIAFRLFIAVMLDSLRINRKNEEWARIAGLPYESLFNERDLERLVESDMLYTVNMADTPYWVRNTPWTGWNIGFDSAGHTSGAIMTFIESPGDRPALFTGDVSSRSSRTVTGKMLPGESFLDGFLELPGLVMVTEATNGARRATSTPEQVEEEIYNYLVKEVVPRDGIAFFPSFAQTKGGDIMKMLVEWGFRPWVDGLIRDVVRIEVPETEQWLKEEKIFFFDEDDREHADFQRQRVAQGEFGFTPVIASSATLNKGVSVKHAEMILPERKNTVIFMGYTFEGSVAREMLNLGVERGRTIKLSRYIGRGKTVPVYVNVVCDVKHFDRSSHDYQDGLVERARLVNPSTLIVEHCDDEGFEGFRTALQAVAPQIPVIWGSHMKEIVV